MKSSVTVAVAALAVLLGACRTRAPNAYGEANSIIVAVPDSVWLDIGDTVQTALEPRIFTVRDERTFQVTQTSPRVSEWRELRKFRQTLVIGRADDPWVEPVLSAAGASTDALPGIVEAEDVWARGQHVTAIVLPPDDDGTAVAGLLPQLHELLDTRFRRYARTRMFASGVNEALRDTLRQEAGFSVTVPNVYRWTREDSVYVFRNPYDGENELIRTVLVTWRTGTGDEPTAESTLAWRDALSAEHYGLEQVTLRDRIEERWIEGAAHRTYQVQGTWSTPEGSWPAAGPFIDRVVSCPEQNRTYFLDAWLYAPGDDKYEYMLQLETILDSFECGGA